MNEVTVDETRLAAEADAAISAAPAAELAPGLEAPADAVPDTWAPVVANLQPLLQHVAFAQWQIRDEEAREVCAALGQCLDQVFPGGINGPYACWVRLGVGCAGITVARIAMFGHIPPLGLPRAVPKEEKSGTPANDAQ